MKSIAARQQQSNRKDLNGAIEELNDLRAKAVKVEKSCASLEDKDGATAPPPQKSTGLSRAASWIYTKYTVIHILHLQSLEAFSVSFRRFLFAEGTPGLGSL